MQVAAAVSNRHLLGRGVLAAARRLVHQRGQRLQLRRPEHGGCQLKAASERFKNDDRNKDLARDCAIKAWQLCDHVFNALGSTSRFTTLGGLQEHVRNTCPELAYLQDICTASKYGEDLRYPARIDDTRVQDGAFSHAFSRGFDISRLEIKLPGGQTIFFNDVLDRAVDFWSKFFDDNGIMP